MGGYGGDAQGTGEVPPPGGMEDHGTGGKTRGRRRVVVPLGSGGNETCGAPPHRGVHQETEGIHSIKGGLQPHL